MNELNTGLLLPRNFHTYRGYLTAGKRKSNPSQEIIVYSARCFTQGCSWSERYTSREARETGSWLHRKDKILAYRLDHLQKHATDPALVQAAMRTLADNESHTFTGYMIAVDAILQGRLPDIDSTDIPDFDYRLQYLMGMTAGLCAEHAIGTTTATV